MCPANEIFWLPALLTQNFSPAVGKVFALRDLGREIKVGQFTNGREEKHKRTSTG
jgi:hypothetical protein